MCLWVEAAATDFSMSIPTDGAYLQTRGPKFEGERTGALRSGHPIQGSERPCRDHPHADGHRTSYRTYSRREYFAAGVMHLQIWLMRTAQGRASSPELIAVHRW
jgi:hypothetical protein